MHVDWFKLLSWCFLIAVYLFTLYMMDKRIDGLLDSDMSSEMILAQLLAEENGILSSNWYYSTELRVLNTQIVYAFFFKIFDNWHTVRIMSYAVMYGILAASCIYLCKSLKCEKYGVLVSAILLLPFSYGYFRYILRGAYYIPHICISFVGLGLVENYVNNKAQRKCRFELAAALLLAVIAGLGGPRQLIILYLPLALTGVLLFIVEYFFTSNKKFTVDSIRYALASIICLMGSSIGYIINAKFLSKAYHFKQWDDMRYVSFDLSRLNTIIAGFMDSYGWTVKEVFSTATIKNGVCILLMLCTLAAILYGIKSRESNGEYYRTAVFESCAIIIFVALYMFTNMGYSNRYNLPVIIFFAPLLALMVDNFNETEKLKEIAISCVVLVICVTSIAQYRYMLRTSTEHIEIAQSLTQQGYTSGYATFWNANILTELSNGQIEVWDIGDPSDEAFADKETVDEYIYTWLQYTSHSEAKPEGKVFILLSTVQYDVCKWQSVLRDKDIVYRSNDYRIYGYDDYWHIPQAVRNND